MPPARRPSEDQAEPATSARLVRLEDSHARVLRIIAAVVGVVGLTTSAVLIVAASGTAEATRYVFALGPALVGAMVVTGVGLQRRRIRLWLTEEGLEYHAFGAAVRARWEDLVAFAHVEHGPFAGTGVTLSRVAESPGSLTSRVWRLAGFRPPRHAIPLSPFVGQARGTWLEMELRRRVPTLGDLGR